MTAACYRKIIRLLEIGQAGGSVGTAMIQLCRLNHIEVYGTVLKAKHELVLRALFYWCVSFDRCHPEKASGLVCKGSAGFV